MTQQELDKFLKTHSGGEAESAIGEFNSTFNTALKQGNTAEVERLNPLFTLYNGALVRKDQLQGFQQSGATVSNGQVNAQPLKFAQAPAGMPSGQAAINAAIQQPTGITSSNGMSPTALVGAIQNQGTQPLVFSQAVKDEQIALNKKGAGLVVDGLLGPKTLAARAQYGQNTTTSTYDTKTGFLTDYGKSIGAKAVQPNDPANTKSVVGTSDQARTETREQAIARQKAELEAGTNKPTQYNSVAEYDKLRTEKGVVEDENELNAIQNEARMAKEELNQLKQTAGKEIGMGGYTGNISEAERNLNFRLSSLALRETAVVDRLNTKNSYINTVLQLGEKDYEQAYTEYTNEYNKNLKAIEMYNSELAQDKKDALTGLTTTYNLLKDAGITTLDPATKVQMNSYEMQLGIPVGTYENALTSLPEGQKIINTTTTDNANGGKDITFITNGKDGPKIYKTISVGGTGGGSGVSGNLSGVSSIDDIKAIQTQLNAQGANLVVDGKMGPKTQAAMVKAGMTAPTTDSFVQSLLNTKGGKSLTDTSIQKLDKGLTVLGQLGVLQANVEKVKTGPIVGAFKSANPWDTQAQTIKAQLNAIVPNLARGVYGEVGVLTDNDIKTYAGTIPNLKSTEEVRNAVLYITLDMIGKSIKNTLSVNAAAGRDVSGFVDIYTEMEATKNSILSSIPSAQVPQAFQNTDPFLNQFSPQSINNALNNSDFFNQF